MLKYKYQSLILSLLLCCAVILPTQAADRFAVGLGVGQSLQSNSFSDSGYINIWAGTYGGSKRFSGFYASGNIATRYFRDSERARDTMGNPIGSSHNLRSEFWTFNLGPTKTVSRYLTLYGGAGLAHRNGGDNVSSATRLNVNAGALIHIGRDAGFNISVDSVNRGVVLGFAYRVY